MSKHPGCETSTAEIIGEIIVAVAVIIIAVDIFIKNRWLTKSEDTDDEGIFVMSL